MSRGEALLAQEPDMGRTFWCPPESWMNILHDMEKTVSKNLGILFETVSTIGIVGKSKRVHPVRDVLLPQTVGRKVEKLSGRKVKQTN